MTEDRSQKSDDRGQMKEDRGQKSGVREQRFFEFGLRPIGPMPRREVEMRNAEWGIMISGIFCLY